MEDLGLPKAILRKSLASYNALNTYTTKAQASQGDSITFLVRTYQKFTEKKLLDRLLDNLNAQKMPLAKLDISAVVFSTDKESMGIVEDNIKTYSSVNQYGVDVHVHKIPLQVYEDNCCQVEEMCSGEKFAKEWGAHAKRKYGHYHHFQEKIDTVCKGNNLLHYVLTDLTLRHVVDSCSVGCDRKYVSLTNGDNSYDENFVWKAVEKLREDSSTDFIMTDYLERGDQKVESTLRINQMDLGCMVFRISSLQRLFPQGLLYLASLPAPNTWPDHYYGADGEFVTRIVKHRGVKWAKVNEVLFTHW